MIETDSFLDMVFDHILMYYFTLISSFRDVFSCVSTQNKTISKKRYHLSTFSQKNITQQMIL